MKSETKQNVVYPANIQGIIKAESLVFWGLPLIFFVHLLDEVLLNGGFVSGVQQYIWPAYNYVKFGLVNAGFILIISLSSYLYRNRPDTWIFLPLFWLWERSWNGVWHILWTLIWQEYTPGLGTSFLFGILLLFMLRKPENEKPSRKTVILSCAAGLAFEALLISTLFIFR